MEIVINIPDRIHYAIELGITVNGSDASQMLIDAVKNGTPLPKGHGRLIDADKTKLLSDLFCYTKYTGIDEAPYEDATKALEYATTIIEADKESGK